MNVTNTRPALLDALRSRILIGDGAMTTLLHQSGLPLRSCSEEQNLRANTRVAEIHTAYVHAGANVLQTNTFAAHRPGLRRYGLEGDIVEINRTGVELARAAAGNQAWVLGTVGSIAGSRPYGGLLDDDTRQTLADAYEEQASILNETSLDGFMLETFADLDDMLLAIAAVRRVSKQPIFAHLSPDEVGVTRDGVALSDAFEAMLAGGADVVGLNCRLGPNGILRSYESLTRIPGTLYGAMPNAGLLRLVEGDYSYTGNAQYFAETAVALASLGVRFLGGCCGTTPEYIQCLSERLRTVAVSEITEIASGSLPEVQSLAALPHVRMKNEQVDSETVQRRTTDTLVDKVKLETTVITELDPPKTLELDRYLQGAKALVEAGTDFITLADNSMGSIRISNLAVAARLEQMGIRTLAHVTCRDRNLIGQQSYLMGFHMLGVHHILLITGDPSKYGDLPGATSVYDVSSIELTRMVKRLNEGIGFSGQSLNPPATFLIGTSFNPHVRNFSKALERLRRKVEAGADYVMTQPIYDERILDQLANATHNLGVPIFAGIMPLVSARNATFLHNEVPGIEIPKPILDAMQSVAPEDAHRLGLDLAKRMVDKTRSYFKGIYLITPFLRYAMTVELTKHAKEI